MTAPALTDGEFLPYDDVSASIGTRAFQRDSDTFERLRGGRNARRSERCPLCAQDHSPRLLATVRSYGMTTGELIRTARGCAAGPSGEARP